MRRFFANRLAALGLAMVAAVFLTAALAPVLAPYDPARQDLAHTQASPSRHHLLGTDELGRDQLSRIVYGSRAAVEVGVLGVAAALVAGVALGSLAGALSRRWDTLIMRVADAFFAFPVLVGATVIVLLTGRGVPSVVLAVGVFGWATIARLLRSSMLAVREAGYVEAATAAGASRRDVVVRHVLPNSLGPVAAYATVSVGLAVVAEASLGFLGVGVAVGTADWGTMIASGQEFFGYKDYLWIFPSLALVVTVLGFVLLGDGVGDALDPKRRAR